MTHTPLAHLHQWMHIRNIGMMLIPYQDIYHGEYLVKADQFIEHITGFTGSAGFLIVLRPDLNAKSGTSTLFVDGRYTLQAGQQVDTNTYTIAALGQQNAWLRTYLNEAKSSKHTRIAYDPWTFTVFEEEQLHHTCSHTQHAVCAPYPHMLSSICADMPDFWTRRPAHPHSQLFSYPVAHAGVPAHTKVARMQAHLKAHKIDGMVLGPESWAWMLNVRGRDLPHTPIAQGFAWLSTTHIDLFLHGHLPHSNTSPFEKEVKDLVTYHSIDHFEDFLKAQSSGVLGYDPRTTPAYVVSLFEHKTACKDPCIAPKAVKHEKEIEGAIASHIEDAVAWCKFWHRFEHHLKHHSPCTLRETDMCAWLLEARRESKSFQSESFDTIAGCGPNGAIIHYKPHENHCLSLQNGTLLLLDSGGQYMGGTTDITRTLGIGSVPQFMKKHYTLVLQGHIALASCVFPKGTTGPQLDALARRPLWQHGLDYAHGTGHGVGNFLSVHEGPQNISHARCTAQHCKNATALEKGMILSNEPGYYLEGHYGIRLENLVYVDVWHPSPTPKSMNAPCDDAMASQNIARGGKDRFLGSDRQEMAPNMMHDAVSHSPWLCFKDLTLVPFDASLILFDTLTFAENAWLRDYHARILNALLDHLPPPLQTFLKEKCEPFMQNAYI